MIHYAVVVDGTVIGSRSSKHAIHVYTHAVVKPAFDGLPALVISYHAGTANATKALHSRSRHFAVLSIHPVIATAKRLPYGALPATVCGSCGSSKPADRSCVCFDNGCQ